MNGISVRDPQLIGAIAAALVCIGGIVAWAVFRRHPTADEIEHARRAALVKSSRIIDGTVVDISEIGEVESGRPGGMQLILYKYEVAGVIYECAQDVTSLHDYVDIHECRLAFPCSVRYDPHLPANSVIVSEGWSGLRDTADSIPAHNTPHSNWN